MFKKLNKTVLSLFTGLGISAFVQLQIPSLTEGPGGLALIVSIPFIGLILTLFIRIYLDKKFKNNPSVQFGIIENIAILFFGGIGVYFVLFFLSLLVL